MSPAQKALSGAGVATVLVTTSWLIASAWAKLLDVPTFEALLLAHGVVADPASIAVAYPALELAAGAAALWMAATQRRVDSALFVAGLPFALVTLYAFWLAIYPPATPAPCGCGVLASGDDADWLAIALRNALLLAAMLLIGRSLTRLEPGSEATSGAAAPTLRP